MTTSLSFGAKAGKKDMSKWHAWAAGYLGECFDAMDATIFFIVLYPAISELINSKNDAAIGWYGSLILASFMLGWAIGGTIFGVVADKMGRAKTMAFTILVYAIFTGLCATSHSWWEMAIYRFFVGMGVGGEISLGTVIVSEYWKQKKQRIWATAWLDTSFSVGLVLASCANLMVGGHGWRWLFVIGMLPALATLYIRYTLKEPDSFEAMRNHKELLKNKNPKDLTESESRYLQSPFKQLFSSEYKTTIIALFCIASSAIIGYWSCVSWISPWINQLTGELAIGERSLATNVLSVGSIIGAISTPLWLNWLGRRNTIRFAFGGCMLAVMVMFVMIKSFCLPLLALIAFIGLTVGLQFTFLCIYIPEAFATNVLGTASGFTFSAGRIFAALIAVGGGQLIAMYQGSYAMASATVAIVYAIGFVAANYLPETNGEVKGTGIDDKNKIAIGADTHQVRSS